MGLLQLQTVLLSLARLRNDLYCVEWGVKLYSNQPAVIGTRETSLSRVFKRFKRFSKKFANLFLHTIAKATHRRAVNTPRSRTNINKGRSYYKQIHACTRGHAKLMNEKLEMRYV